MRPPPPTPAPTLQYRLLIVTVLTALFMQIHYMGSALYELAGGLTTVKPYSGVALALILLLGEDWLVPVLGAGIHAGFEETVGAAAVGLGAIERKIGILQEFIGILSILGRQ